MFGAEVPSAGVFGLRDFGVGPKQVERITLVTSVDWAEASTMTPDEGELRTLHLRSGGSFESMNLGKPTCHRRLGRRPIR